MLARTVTAVVRVVVPVSVHGDGYLDLTFELDEPRGQSLTGRLSAGDCPPDLSAGERVSVRLLLGRPVAVTRV